MSVARPRKTSRSVKINADELLLAYRLGIFPMAETRDAEDVLWVRPRERGILPVADFHVPKRLARTLRHTKFEIRVDTAFAEVVRGCADTRNDTWINPAIADVFDELHARKFAHSVECWEDGKLVGGVYGLALRAAFFAESKFSRATDASKIALVHLARRLKAGGFTLLDAQFPNPHLEQFGALAISETQFDRMLSHALEREADFYRIDTAKPAAPSLNLTAFRSPAA
jgi:leucyl/phenylalanyl-tRNA--protein transferase